VTEDTAQRTALVVGVANKRSIAWAIAEELAVSGVKVALTFQNERVERDVRKLADEIGAPCIELDVQDDAMLTAAVAQAAGVLGGGIDTLVHSVAFASAGELGGRYIDTSREGFRMALEISAYSLTALARAAEPHMIGRPDGGSIMTLTYIASGRAMPGYNVMGIAKAALESMVRYLAWDLGPARIRVNAISAGPIRTLAARGIPGFATMADSAAERTPLRREVTAKDVAGLAVFLASPASAGVTGEVIFADAGFHAMGL
jgi:enoyl-[acyl-carrier protein] reductase I